MIEAKTEPKQSEAIEFDLKTEARHYHYKFLEWPK